MMLSVVTIIKSRTLIHDLRGEAHVLIITEGAEIKSKDSSIYTKEGGEIFEFLELLFCTRTLSDLNKRLTEKLK